jgi:predicted dehydrogenase
VFAESIGGPAAPETTDDQCFITLRHADGSVSNIAYLAGGDKSCPKERIEVFGGGITAILDDFRQLTVYKNGKRSMRKGRQDKGHAAEIDAFAEAVSRAAAPPIPWRELRTTTLASLLAVESLRTGEPQAIEE